MDYVFFAFSALSLGFAVFLAALMFDRQKKKTRWPFLLLSLSVALAYYSLEIWFFGGQPVVYLLANTMPQGFLLICLAAYLWRHDRPER